MKLVGEKAAAFAAKPKRGVWSALCWCEDEGVANDAARLLVSAWTGKGDDVEIVSLGEDEIRREPGLLWDALEARSLLGATRMVRVQTTGDKIASLLVEVLSAGDTTPDRFEARLIITAGSLPTKSKLRAGFEAAKGAASLQLFADEIGDVSALVSETLAREGIVIEEAAVALLAAHLPGHRRMIHAEIEKLALYARELGRPVAPEDVRALCVSGIDASADAFVSAVFDRDTAAALDALDRLAVAGTSAITLIRALQRETQKLLAVAALGPGAGAEAGMKLRPPVFRSQWPLVTRRVRAWPAPLLGRILERIYDLEQRAKLAGPVADIALRQLAVQLTTQPVRSG